MSYEQDVIRPWSLHELRCLGDVTVAIRCSPHGMWSVTKKVLDGPVQFLRVAAGSEAEDLVNRALEGDASGWSGLAVLAFPTLEEQVS